MIMYTEMAQIVDYLLFGGARDERLMAKAAEMIERLFKENESLRDEIEVLRNEINDLQIMNDRLEDEIDGWTERWEETE